MQLDYIALDRLAVSKTNMRQGAKAPDVSDILPTIRKRGVIQPLLVRPGSESGQYEIIAGRRRFTAACLVARELREAGGERGDAQDSLHIDPLPCAILDAGDDATAIEASMIENMARLDADEVTQWESFVRLVKQGRDVADIAATFGLPELAVRRILALGNLLPPIRALYRNGMIDRASIRHLTMASKAQQKAWLALAEDEHAYCPIGNQLKAWLFGGQSIPVRHALFDVTRFDGRIIADLFGEDGYFADPDAFWTAQYAAIDARRAAYLEDGWADVMIVPPSDHFHSWEYEKTAKRKGGRIYADVRASGEVIFHEGYLSRKEAQRAQLMVGGNATMGSKPSRPELSGPCQTYIDLHRHAAVRAGLVGHQGVALRLMVAHAMIGSAHWTVHREPQTSRNEATAKSLERSRAEALFDERRRAVMAALDLPSDQSALIAAKGEGGHGGDDALARIFLKLLDLPDSLVMEIVTIVMGETLEAGSAVIEAVGLHIGTDMADWWQADDALFALIRDRELLVALVRDVAGEAVATANLGATSKVLKSIISDHLTGTNGRRHHDRWVPRWMRFAPSAYTERGGVGTVDAFARIAPPAAKTPAFKDPASKTPAPDPEQPPREEGDTTELPRAA
ncbi:ParB N-terminal domain-containing protein [Sphingobium phenoxybenzoativorans]|uniref:ParB N-terminal domain-containing protein n=1 Tax=Sphingobium phenoxybenzoativorans TaxID=1592790 RepID=A0A975K6A0_9SPHN|nr:ParB N-terminal domain-containing protein [Sphingobium phenoxybenzoativorans]QUT05134.1 ParB N-terminal domain-containing protein [Sphingobium phenoxybenzoativorans]